MEKSVPAIGFAILTIITLLIVGYAVYEAWVMAPIFGIVLTVVLVCMLYTLFNEAKGVKNSKAGPLFSQKNLLTVLAVAGGALATYTISISFGRGAVVAAGIVGLVAGLFIKDYAAPIYSGAFVGMASSALFQNQFEIILPGVVAGIVFVLAATELAGFGGKLGTIAVTGCITCAIALNHPFANPKVPPWSMGWMLVVTSVVAAVVTYYIGNNMKKGAVVASAIVGLVAGIVLPVVFGANGRTMAVMAICASFGGMSAPKRIPSLLWMGVAGVLIALVYIYSSPLAGGAGGKLGTIAFGSVMAVRGFLDLMAKYTSFKA